MPLAMAIATKGTIGRSQLNHFQFGEVFDVAHAVAIAGHN
ncbi:hypothetical protein MYVA_3145 [Mycolicibacterium vaccae 95051]|nr:hypothetical protein MYVA_3145 [Mycolicibacterium vaccae 95051]